MDGSNGGAPEPVWRECTVQWKTKDCPAVAAWIAHADGRGVGVIVYTTPQDKLVTGNRLHEPYKREFRYVVSGFLDGVAPTVEQAMIDAAACARCANPDQSQSRFKSREQWLCCAITLK